MDLGLVNLDEGEDGSDDKSSSTGSDKGHGDDDEKGTDLHGDSADESSEDDAIADTVVIPKAKAKVVAVPKPKPKAFSTSLAGTPGAFGLCGLDIAPTGRAVCIVCSAKVEQGSVRFKFRRPQKGRVEVSVHRHCVQTLGMETLVSIDVVHQSIKFLKESQSSVDPAADFHAALVEAEAHFSSLAIADG